MANVVWLKPDEDKPEGIEFALVAQDQSGCHTGSGFASGDGRGCYYNPQAERDQAIAIEKATAWADRHGVATVYVSVR